jgi:integrase
VEVIKQRPEATDSNNANLVFLTRFGNPWIGPTKGPKGRWTDSITLQFAKLLRKLDLKKPGRSFYSLRRTFATIASDSLDQAGINLVMGHSDNSMSELYRQRVDDQRLVNIARTVRSWLWPETSTRNLPTADQ